MARLPIQGDGCGQWWRGGAGKSQIVVTTLVVLQRGTTTEVVTTRREIGVGHRFGHRLKPVADMRNPLQL